MVGKKIVIRRLIKTRSTNALVIGGVFEVRNLYVFILRTRNKYHRYYWEWFCNHVTSQWLCLLLWLCRRFCVCYVDYIGELCTQFSKKIESDIGRDLLFFFFLNVVADFTLHAVQHHLAYVFHRSFDNLWTVFTTMLKYIYIYILQGLFNVVNSLKWAANG